MALKALVDSLDGIDSHFHELYTERNGKFELTGVEGFKTQADVDRINAALTKERNDHKDTKNKFAPFANFDPEDVRSKLDRFEELELAAAGKLDENKINSIVEARLKQKVAPVERERDLYRTQLTEKDTLLGQFQSERLQRTIFDKVRDAATSAKVLPEAMEDALMLAERVFEVSEDGRVVTKDNVGVTPGIEASVWFTELQTKKPHWWGPSVGGGGRGSNTPGGGNTNPFTSEHWNLTEQGKLVTTNRARAEQLAKSAGTSIGGPRPPARK